MNDFLSKFAISYIGIPATKDEDYIPVFGSYTVWRDDLLREYNWGKNSTIYIAHQKKMVPVYYSDVDEENQDKAGQPTGEMRESVSAMAITVPNPVTREKLFQQGIFDIYRVNGLEEQLSFTQKMLTGNIENPDSEEVKTYKEVSRWLNWELDKWEGITLEMAKEKVIAEIDSYDTSDNVNSFFLQVGDQQYQWWIDRNTRISLSRSVQIEKETQEAMKVPEPRTTIWYNSIELNLSCDAVQGMLNALELYALACYGTTAAHIATVEKMESIEEVLNYDYTDGYPEKLTFNIG